MTTPSAAQASIELVMQAPARTIDPRATLREAAALLRDLDIGTLVIMSGDDIVGIVSERDIVHAIAEGTGPDVAVGTVMTREPRYATAADDVQSALHTMLAAGVRHLPVVDEGEVVGMVSMRDLVASLAG